jgi:hypothetical protein
VLCSPRQVSVRSLDILLISRWVAAPSYHRPRALSAARRQRPLIPICRRHRTLRNTTRAATQPTLLPKTSKGGDFDLMDPPFETGLRTSNALMTAKPSSASGYSDCRIENDFRLLDRQVGGRAHSSQWHNDSLDPMTKPHHQMTVGDWRIFRENFAISVLGGQTPPPLRSFDEAGSIHPALLQAIQHVLQFRHPSPIQRQAIPIGLQRRD